MVKEKNPNSLIVKYGIILLFVFHELQASLDCSFDHGYCGWQQETSDTFDWRRDNFNTSTQGTGPSRDHTDGFGYYIYIEASNRHNGDTARLNSPVQESGQYCLTFWVSMYGSNIGSLNVYIKGNKETLIFSRNRSVRDNAWRNVLLNLNVPERYKIVLEGIRGNGYSGDIAIDDIAITTGTCADCNFDNGICHWTQSNSDDFDWTLQKGGTPTPGTGPTADHTSKYGQYLYTESTYRSRGDKAWLVSPLLYPGKYCFSFWFNMYGEHVDRLKVEGVWYQNGTSTELFRKTGNQGHKWIQGNIFIHFTTYFTIVFEGRVKNARWNLRNKGDIAIDDISMTSCHDCDDPTPTHASANTTNFTYGSEIEIKCDKGYSLMGESNMICQADGSWSVRQPTCKLYDCGNRTITNGNFNSSNGTTFGQTASQVCNNGYTVVGDTKVVCTSSGWNSPVATCTLVDDAERSALIVVYVLVPVVMVLGILFTTFILRRRHPKREKVAECKQESHKSSTVQFSNATFSGQTPEYQNHTNHSDKDRSLHLNDNAAITDDKSTTIVTSDTVYYTTGAEHALKKDCAHDYDHIHKSVARQYVNDSYSHIPGRSFDTTYESSYNATSDLFSGDSPHRANTQRKKNGCGWLNINNCKKTIQSQQENEESDYDHAHAGGADPVAAKYDDYSHLDEAILKTTYPPSNENHEYSSVNKIMQHKEWTVKKSKAGYEKPWC